MLDGGVHEDEEKRALDKRKYLALNKRCKDIEQVCKVFSMHAMIHLILFT